MKDKFDKELNQEQVFKKWMELQVKISKFLPMSASRKYYTKLSRPVSFEVKLVWYVEKVTIVLVAIGATGIIHNGFWDIDEKLEIKFIFPNQSSQNSNQKLFHLQ